MVKRVCASANMCAAFQCSFMSTRFTKMLSRNLVTSLLNLSLHHGTVQRTYCRRNSFTRLCICFHGNKQTNQGVDLSKRTRHFESTHYRQTTDGSAGEGDEEKRDAVATAKSYLEARRKGVLKGKRRLSPLDRVGGMIMDEDETKEDNSRDQALLRDPRTGGIGDYVEEGGADERGASRQRNFVQSGESSVDDSSAEETNSFDKAQRQGPPLVDGEYIIITRENLKRQEKMFRLIKLDANLEFKCKFGNVPHADIIGHQSGSIFVTDLDIELLIRRPSLDEYVLYMKRHPVIAYPKDCCTMLMMIDASPGDVVLEAGSGSGSMTLFLSRAVGHHGHVLSFEKMPTHQVRAKQNFKLWQKSYDISNPVKWPQNVSFYPCRLQDCRQYIKDAQVDGAIIDMEEPSRVMATMSQRLKSGKTMAVYVANLGQVVDIAEVIRKERLPLVIETTLEVAHKEWVVNPARRYGGTVLQEPTAADKEEIHNEGAVGKSKGLQNIADEVPKYITRPHHMQLSHTAFLVKIRKIRTSASTFKI